MRPRNLAIVVLPGAVLEDQTPVPAGMENGGSVANPEVLSFVALSRSLSFGRYHPDSPRVVLIVTPEVTAAAQFADVTHVLRM